MPSFSNQLSEAFIAFRREIYPDERNSIMCSIHDQFQTANDRKHNCLGCNFAESTSWIHNELHNAVSEYGELEPEFYVDYLMKLYLFVERAYIVFDLVQLPVEYRSRHFGIFQKIHKWANFIKHPKSFLLVHHAQYFLEDDSGAEILFDREKFGVVIDQEFVSKYYSGSERNAELFRLLTNKTNVAVLFPNVEELTHDFIAGIHKFIELIRDNAVYREILDARSTYENYFESTSTASPSPPAPQ